jgi:hypothetical protein
MIRTFTCATMLVWLSVFFVPWVHAGDLTPEYLYGRWVIDDKNCNSPNSEYLEFRKNRTFEIARTGKAEIVGFWGIKADTLELHMVTSPAFFDDLHEQLAGFEGEYDYFRGKMVLFNTNNSGFEAVGVVGNEMRRATAVKCK